MIQVDAIFKDNKWRFLLLEITTTTNEMNTFLIAQALVPTESTESLLWVFEQVYMTIAQLSHKISFTNASSTKADSHQLSFLWMMQRDSRLQSKK